MRRLILAMVIVVLGALSAPAQDGGNAAIQSTIQSQIDAFQADDLAAAFGLASPNIRRIFGSSENFGLMVRQGYPMVWRPSELRFLELKDIGGRMFQTVMIRDGAGALHVLEYQMIMGDDGWLINGVRIVEQPELGA